MKYNPKCDSCKHFEATDKTPKAFKRHRVKRSNWLYEGKGYCNLGYCVKEKKQVYRKNMR